jgi:hypothetical protein
MGEGVEKTLAVYLAYLRGGRDISTTAFWSAGDLGNLAGKAAKTVRDHSDPNPRKRVGGPDPDLTEPGIVIPESVTDLILLGDSTNPFMTLCAMYRAFQRYSRAGRRVRVYWAPPGKDFDDLVRGAA